MVSYPLQGECLRGPEKKAVIRYSGMLPDPPPNPSSIWQGRDKFSYSIDPRLHFPQFMEVFVIYVLIPRRNVEHRGFIVLGVSALC